MKANEAPEKLYMPFEDEIDRDCLNTYAQKNTYHKEIEYIRTDAFIEKAIEYIITHIPDMHTLGNGCKMDEFIIDDFKKAMKL